MWYGVVICNTCYSQVSSCGYFLMVNRKMGVDDVMTMFLLAQVVITNSKALGLRENTKGCRAFFSSSKSCSCISRFDINSSKSGNRTSVSKSGQDASLIFILDSTYNLNLIWRYYYYQQQKKRPDYSICKWKRSKLQQIKLMSALIK